MGKLLCEKNVRDVWCRNESVRAEIGQILQTHTHTDRRVNLSSTVEPLSNDHHHQRPSLLYDHIFCDGQWFLFVRSLTNDHPSDATSDRFRWKFLPRGRPHRVFQNDCEGMSDRGQHILHILPIGGSTQRTQKDCVSLAKVVDDTSR